MRRIAAIAIGVGMGFVPARALSQDQPVLRVSGYYSVLRNTASTIPVGIGGELAVQVAPRAAVVAEGDLNTRTIVSLGSDKSRASFYSVLGGARVALFEARRVHVFGQALLGMTHVTLSERPLSPDIESVSASYSLAQPGVGVEIDVTRRLACRVGSDLRIVRLSSDPSRQVRLTAGVTFRP